MLVVVVKARKQAPSGRNVNMLQLNHSTYRPDGAYENDFLLFSTNMTSLWDLITVFDSFTT